MKNLTFLGLLLLSVCCSPRYVETQLYFGQSKPDGSMVTAQEWENFKKTHLSKTFPQGFTILKAEGGWYDSTQQQLIMEPSYEVSHLYSKSKKKSLQIDQLREAYKSQFQQQSVLRIDKRIKANF